MIYTGTYGGSPATQAFPLYLMGSAIVVLAIFIPSVRRGHASLRWPRAEGRILSNEDAVAISRDVLTGPQTEQMPVVMYEYSVEEQVYRGNTLCEPGPASLLRMLREDELRPGQRVSVSYDPRRHSASVLYPGASIGAWFAVAGAVALFIWGIVALARVGF